MTASAAAPRPPHAPARWFVWFGPHKRRPPRDLADWCLERILGRLRPGFRHVGAVARCEVGWLVVDPLSDVLRVHWTPALDAATAQRLAEASVVLMVEPRPPERYRPRGLLTCVSIVAHLLGVRGAITPYQLCRALRARGATEV